MSTVRDRELRDPEAAPEQTHLDAGDSRATTSPESARRRLVRIGGILAVAIAAVAVAFVAGQGGSATNATPAPSPSASATPNATSAQRNAPMATATSSAQFHGVKVAITTKGSAAANRRYQRIVSAPTDLTGFRELAWHADAGHAVGDAQCTQNFRFSPSTPAGERPTTLLCWRTSAAKSAYAFSVDLDQKPSEQDAVAALEQGWNSTP
jgi:hypothetical protein